MKQVIKGNHAVSHAVKLSRGEVIYRPIPSPRRQPSWKNFPSCAPTAAWTTTTPAGALKAEPKKDIARIMLAHHIPYLATASIAYPDDLIRKFKKARGIEGARFIHLLSPCPPGWRIDPGQSVRVSRLAPQSNVFPLYEVENGTYALSVHPGGDAPRKGVHGSPGTLHRGAGRDDRGRPGERGPAMGGAGGGFWLLIG